MLNRRHVAAPWTSWISIAEIAARLPLTNLRKCVTTILVFLLFTCSATVESLSLEVEDLIKAREQEAEINMEEE